MRIASLETALYRIELPVPLSNSTHGTMTHFELVTVRLRDEDGAEGVGYTYTTGAGGSAVHALIDQGLRHVLMGADADLIEALWTTMWWRLHYGGRGGSVSLAVSACDIALYDLRAPAEHSAVAHARRVRSGGALLRRRHRPGVHARCAAETDRRQPRQRLSRHQDESWPARLSEDRERVRAMRAHLGDDFPLMADANMRWTVDQSIAAARAFRDSNLTWLEEPTIPDDIAGHARIVREGGVPIATGENLHTLHEFTQMISAGGVTFPEPDVTNCGGITVFMKVAHLAEAFNLPVTSHGAHDLTVHLLAARAQSLLPRGAWLRPRSFHRTADHDHRGRCAGARDRPGHGVAFDWAALEKTRER